MSDAKRQWSKILLSPWFILVLGAVLLTVAMLLGGPMGNDEGVWAYIGRIWADHGVLPYSGAIENKATGIFMLYAASQWLFGLNIWFPRLLAVLFTLGTGFFIYLLTKKFGPKRAALFAMTIFILTMPLNSTDGTYAETEVFMNFFRILAFLFSLLAFEKPKRRLFVALSGVAYGWAIAFKQLAVLDVIPLIAFHLVFVGKDWKRFLEHALWFVVGALGATGMSLVPYLLSGGTISNYIDGAWLILLRSGSSPATLVSRISGFFAHFFNVRLAFLALALLAYIISRKKLAAATPYTVPLLIWALTDFLAYNADGWYLEHHLKVFIPSWSIIFGLMIDYGLSRLRVHHGAPGRSTEDDQDALAILAMVGLLIFYIPFETNYYQNIRKNLRGDVFDTSLTDLGIYARHITKPGDYIYIWGLHIGPTYYYSNRLAPSRYFSEPFLGQPGALAEVEHDFVVHPPRFIFVPVDREPPSAWLEKIIQSGYHLRETKFGHNIYERKL